MPYFPYSRQSKKKAHRGAITARMLANLMKVAGVDHVITIDLHANQMQGFFKCPVDNLRAEPLIAKWIRQNVEGWNESVVVSKNPGGTKRVTSLADALNVSFGIVTTDRRRPGTSVAMSMVNSGIFEAIGTDGTDGVNQLMEEVAITEALNPEQTTREHDFAQWQRRANGSGQSSRQRAVTTLSMGTRNRLVNGDGTPSSPLANSQRADSVDGDSARDPSPPPPLGLRRTPTAPGVYQPHHDEDGYEESGEDDEDDVSALCPLLPTATDLCLVRTRRDHRSPHPRPHR